MKTVFEKLDEFAALVTEHQQKAWTAKGYTHPFSEHGSVKVGKKYARVDVGTSGKYMVDMETQEIYGIKGYGVIHKGHQYGTLDTIQDWNWGFYHAQPLTVVNA